MTGSTKLLTKTLQGAAPPPSGSAPERLDTLLPDLRGRRDRLAPFGPAVLAIRWSTMAVALTFSLPVFVEQEWNEVFWVALALALTTIRTVGPIRDHGDDWSLANLLAELLLFILAVTFTGMWSSALVFPLMSTIVVAGFARGFAFGARIGVVAAIAVSLADYFVSSNSPLIEGDGQILTMATRWTAVLLLVGIVAGYARRISGEANHQRFLAVDRMNRLADANTLLFNLHRITQTLPASLNQDETLDAALHRLRGLIDFDAAVLLTIDEHDDRWFVARKQAVDIGPLLADEELPAHLRRLAHAEADTGVEIADFQPGEGINGRSRASLTAQLRARGNLIGLLSLESATPNQFGRREEELLGRYCEPAALAIDNARWFNRLRTIGADEERSRIARDLHDRIGQSLAHLGFELDRVIHHHDANNEIGSMLSDLRHDLRATTSEVRETLYDLRTDVDLQKDLSQTLEEFATRLHQRSGLNIAIKTDVRCRLPIVQEREFWRIAQEALLNVERHAEAKNVSAQWKVDPSGAFLLIRDDGKGFVINKAGRQDSYGVLGMRERASSIGATFELTSSPGEGTTVRCNLVQD